MDLLFTIFLDSKNCFVMALQKFSSDEFNHKEISALHVVSTESQSPCLYTVGKTFHKFTYTESDLM